MTIYTNSNKRYLLSKGTAIYQRVIRRLNMKPEEEFLKSDFDQCFEQMRHYDSHFISIINFIFSGFAAVIVATIAFLQSTNDQSITLLGSAILFFLAWAVGSLLIAFLLRNRFYFTYVTRYVNEVRGNYLKAKPFAFENKAGLPIDPRIPTFFNPFSAHAILMYFVALGTSIFLGACISALEVLALIKAGQQVVITFGNPIFVSTINFLVELLWIILYLKGCERRKAKKAEMIRNK